MSLSNNQKKEIAEYLANKIIEKLSNYNRETEAMPFHTRLFGKDRLATYSFIQSCNTMLGQSIFEKIGEIIAKPKFKIAHAQYRDFHGELSNERVLIIENIMRDLRSGKRNANKVKEVKEILSKSNKGSEIISTVDLYLKDKENNEYYIEIKSAKPNISEFTEVKRKLLKWVAMANKKVDTLVCIPYNPYHPQQYDRWTLKGLFDLNREVMVGEEFWNFLGGDNTFEELLKIFEDVGKELYQEIEKKIKNVSK